MCHVLDFSDRIDRMSHTLDVTDLLLSKLQIVEMNRKDIQDILYLLAGFEVRDGDEPPPSGSPGSTSSWLTIGGGGAPSQQPGRDPGA